MHSGMRLENDRRPGAYEEFVEGPLQRVCQLSEVTNMGLERLLALIRASTPERKGRRPRATNIACRGVLTQLMRRHLDAGLEDHRGQIRRPELLRRGVRVNLRAAQRRQCGTGARWNLRYANARLAEIEARCQQPPHVSSSVVIGACVRSTIRASAAHVSSVPLRRMFVIGASVAPGACAAPVLSVPLWRLASALLWCLIHRRL